MEESFDLIAPGIEKKNPEDKGPDVMKNTFKDLGVIIGFIFIYIVLYQYVSTGDISNGIDLQNDVNLILSDMQNFAFVPGSAPGSVPALGSSSAPASVPTSVSSSVPTSVVPTSAPSPVPAESPDPIVIEPKIHEIRMDINGFYPNDISINKSDTIIWANVEDQRPRVVLLSKDGLFKNQVLLESNRFEYKFFKKGNYSFVLAEHPSLIEYQKAKGNVIVN